LNLKRSINWQKIGMTQLEAAFIGKHEIDDNAVFQPLFSNLFIGEVMRLDAPDFPLWNAKIKHNFVGKLKFDVSLKAMGQIKANKTSEIDLEFSTKLLNHLKISTILSRIQSDALPNEIYMTRLELRVAF